ncbi:hypothetical protein FACS189499_08190 [Clostridia bacterium]|nr:hypothetical protein FACS189499_08190 [Clostridia bacterium]
MKSKIGKIVRVLVMSALLVTFVFLSLFRLMEIQIVDSDYYNSLNEKKYTAQQSVMAVRGQIADSAGQILSTNEIVYKIIVQRAFFPFDDKEGNDILSETVEILEYGGESWIDSVPVTMTPPFAFRTDATDEELDEFKERLSLNVDASVENCIQAMMKNFRVSEEYGAKRCRAIAGIRYEMTRRDFSFENRYELAAGISLKSVMRLKENRDRLSGIDIIEEPVRVYLDGNTLPHTRGTIGAISPEQYKELKNEGYTLGDTIGKSGVESAMESVLRGKNGVRTIVRDSRGAAVADELTLNVTPGNSVKLTIDEHFQNEIQRILEDGINWLHHTDETVQNPLYRRGQNTKAGSIAVLDVSTGKVLALANYPTYDINDYLNNYKAVLEAKDNPLFNRATSGLYRPGSTFKTITGTSGLMNSVVSAGSHIFCGHVYTYYDDYQPLCTGSHGNISIVGALQVSCNIYFYDVGRQLGIDRINDAAAHFGLGTDLGLETGGASGHLTTPELILSSSGREMSGGDVIQAAIGQMETSVTPLHLAVQAMTLANDGVRYKPYLVDSVWNYDYSELIYENTPKVADEYFSENTAAYATVREGMVRVGDFAVWPPDNMSNSIWAGLPDRPAIKTGTPEAGGGIYNSAVLGYYPAHNPEIAFGIMLENSDFSRYFVRNIIDAYISDSYQPDVNEDGIVVSPWKRR